MEEFYNSTDVVVRCIVFTYNSVIIINLVVVSYDIKAYIKMFSSDPPGNLFLSQKFVHVSIL